MKVPSMLEQIPESANVFFDTEEPWHIPSTKELSRFTYDSFKDLFSPKRIVIIGASSRPEKVGYALLKNILDGQFKGEVIPVNLHAKEILEQKAYRTIDSIEGELDLAIIILKADCVPEALVACGEKGIRSVIVISAGFREMENEQGHELEAELKSIAERYEMLLIGPNCLGLVNTSSNLNATFSRGYPTTGNIAFVSQSGAIGIHALEFAQRHDIGFSKFITIGNKTVCDENDLILHLADDPETRVIIMYLESFTDGERFREVARKCIVEKDTPILLLKAGRSDSGKKAAHSHTGAMASSDEMITYFLRDCGVLRMDTMEDLFSTAMILSLQPPLRGNRLAVISNAGGPAIIAVDTAEKYGLKLIEFPESTVLELETFLPESASTSNPIDLLGDADENRYFKAFASLMMTDDIDAILLICTPQFMTDRHEVLTRMSSLLAEARSRGIAVITSFPAATERFLSALLDINDLPNYEFPDVAIHALSQAVSVHLNSKILSEERSAKRLFKASEPSRKQISTLLATGQQVLNEPQCYSILEHFQMPIAEYGFAHDQDEAISLANAIGYPVVAKIVADGIVHKYDIGGVETNIKNDEDMLSAFQQLSMAVSPLQFKGAVVQRKVLEGIEVIIGVEYHEGFGHAIMFGHGGTYVEVMKDVSHSMLPLSKRRAEQMIWKIKGASMFKGFRGREAVDIDTLIILLMKISAFISNYPQIQSLDLNPVFMTAHGTLIADARIVLR